MSQRKGKSPEEKKSRGGHYGFRHKRPVNGKRVRIQWIWNVQGNFGGFTRYKTRKDSSILQLTGRNLVGEGKNKNPGGKEEIVEKLGTPGDAPGGK